MNLPTEQQCQELFQTYKVPPNIKEHCEKVREVAVFLAKQLQANGENINIDLVNKTALLHDLFKIVAINPKKNNRFHSTNFTDEQLITRTNLIQKYPNMKEHQIAHQFFKDEYPELALALLNSADPEPNKSNLTDLIVCYADVRTFKNKIVSKTERYIYTLEHYPKPFGFWEARMKRTDEIENKIFSKINIKPEQLADKIMT